MEQGYQSQTRVETFKGKKALVKQVKHPGIPLLRDLEWWMLKREIRALKALEEIPEIPRFLGHPDPYSFAMEWRAGKTLREVEENDLPPQFFTRLEEIVQKIHDRDYAHSDLKRKENIMVSPAEEPVVLDFGASFRRKPGFRPINNFFFEQFRRIDLNAVSKYKQRYCPDLLTDAEQTRLNQPVLFETISRLGRKYLLFRD